MVKLQKTNMFGFLSNNRDIKRGICKKLEHWVPEQLHFPNSAGTEPDAKEHIELEHPHEGNDWGLF